MSTVLDTRQGLSGGGARWFVRGLVLSLLPFFLIFSNSTTAQAATTVVDVSFSMGSHWDATYADCTTAGYFVAAEGPGTPPPNVKLRGLSCATGTQFDKLTVSFVASGEGCTFSGSSTELDGTGAQDVILTPGAGYSAALCVVATLCWSAVGDYHYTPGYEMDADGCESFALGSPPAQTAPPPPSSTCEHFDVHSVSVALMPHPLDATTQALQISVKGSRKELSAGIVVRPYMMNNSGYVDMGNQTVWFPGSSSNQSMPQSDGFLAPVQGAGYPVTQWNSQGWRVLGVELISGPYAYNGLGDAAQTAMVHKMQWPAGRPGTLGAITNDPTNCRWYVGELPPGIIVADQSPSGTSSITPWGPLAGGTGTPTPDPEPDPTVPAPEPDDSCAGFSFTDPSSWAGAGMCQAVKALYGIFGALKDVLAAIKGLVLGILDGLKGLFIPSSGFMDSEGQRLTDTVQDSNLNDWNTRWDEGFNAALPGGETTAKTTTEGITTTTSASGGGSWGDETWGAGCAGPGFTWDKFETVGMDPTWYPIAACDGKMAKVALWTKRLCIVGVVLGSMLKILQMLVVALGAGKNINALSFDWKDAAQNRHGDR